MKGAGTAPYEYRRLLGDVDDLFLNLCFLLTASLRTQSEADALHREGLRFCRAHLVLADMSFRTKRDILNSTRLCVLVLHLSTGAVHDFGCPLKEGQTSLDHSSKNTRLLADNSFT